MAEFFNMGGFGVYVWGAMSAVFVLMLGETVLLVIQRKAILEEIKRAKRLEQRRVKTVAESKLEGV